jgi:twitching motility protein PilI
MEAKHLETAGQKQADWLSPTEALTHFLPLEIEVDSLLQPAHAETVFGFHVGSLGLLVAANTHCEVIEQLQVNPLPNVEPWFSGLLNLRGNLVPVIDLRLLLGESSIDNRKRQLFAIGQGDKSIAIWIDGLPEIKHTLTEPLKQLPPLPAIMQRCVYGGYLQDGQIWLNIHFDELFKALGRQHITEETSL